MNENSSGCSPNLDENGLPLPAPFPEYVKCPHCGEPEVEVWCYQTSARCHACGLMLPHQPPACYGSPLCLAFQ